MAWPDDEQQRQEEERRRAQAAALPPAYQTETLPPVATQAPRRFEPGGTLPSTQDQQQPATLGERLHTREQQLMEPRPEVHGWRKFGRVMGDIGQYAGMAYSPELMAHLPGTIANRRAELQEVRAMEGQELGREAAAKEATARTELEGRRLGLEQTKEERELAEFNAPEVVGETIGGGLIYRHKPSGIQRTVYDDQDPREIFADLIGGKTPGPQAAPAQMPSTPAAQQPPGTIPRATAQQPQPMAAPTPAPATRPGQMRPGDVRGHLTPEEQMRDQVKRIAIIPEEKRTAEEQDYFRKNSAQFEKDIPITKEMADRENARRTAEFKGFGNPEPYFVKEGDSLADMKIAARQAASDLTNLRAAGAPARAEAVKMEHNYGYGVRNGQTVYMTEAQAGREKSAWQPATPTILEKDRVAIGQIGDVQMNVSRYTKAAHDYDTAVTNGRLTGPVGSVTGSAHAQMVSDQANLHSLMNKAGLFELKLRGILEFDIPFISAFGEALSRETKSRAYDMLSEQAKALYDGYLITVASIPAYQKMLTETGRSNKEMLDLELNTIADPSMGTTAILRRQQRFQDNINQATKRLPNNLPGLESNMPSNIRKGIESAPPAGATIQRYDPRTGTWK